MKGKIGHIKVGVTIWIQGNQMVTTPTHMRVLLLESIGRTTFFFAWNANCFTDTLNIHELNNVESHYEDYTSTGNDDYEIQGDNK